MDIYLLISLVAIAIYPDFGWLRTIFNLKRSAEPKIPHGKRTGLIPTIKSVNQGDNKIIALDTAIVVVYILKILSHFNQYSLVPSIFSVAICF